MFTRRSLLAWAILLGADSRASARPARPAKFQRWLGRAQLAILLAADRVEAFAIKPWPAGHRQLAWGSPIPLLPPGIPTTIQGYPVYAMGPAQPRSFAEHLVGVLLDEASYWSGGPPFNHRLIKGCIPTPGVAFRVWASHRSVDVLICFTCDQLGIGPSRATFKHRGMAWGDFDPSRAALAGLAHEALPAVPKIQAITLARPRHPRPPD